MPEVVEDSEIWMPLAVKQALGCDEFPVIQYHDALEQDVTDECTFSGGVGLSHIKLGPAKAMLICMTTDKRIIVFDMRCPTHEELVDILLTISGIQFYTIKGPYLQYNLKVEFGIDLKSSVLDLTAFDIFLSMRKASLNGAILGQYSIQRMAESRDDVKYRDRIDLAKCWLGVLLPPKDHVRESAETLVIKDNLGSIAAANVIRKRSCLIRALGLKMQQKLDEIVYQDSENMYNFALKVRNSDYIRYENEGDNSYSGMINFLKQL